MLLYARLITFPYWTLLHELPPLHQVFTTQQFIVWGVHFCVAALYAQHYFPNMPGMLVHVLVMPMIAVPWLLMLIYAKTFWRGYQGDAPHMHWPKAPELASETLLPQPSASHMKEVVKEVSE